MGSLGDGWQKIRYLSLQILVISTATCAPVLIWIGLNIHRYKAQLPLKDQIYNDFKGKSWLRTVTIVVISGVSMGGIG